MCQGVLTHIILYSCFCVWTIRHCHIFIWNPSSCICDMHYSYNKQRARRKTIYFIALNCALTSDGIFSRQNWTKKNQAPKMQLYFYTFCLLSFEHKPHKWKHFICFFRLCCLLWSILLARAHLPTCWFFKTIQKSSFYSCSCHWVLWNSDFCLSLFFCLQFSILFSFRRNKKLSEKMKHQTICTK